MAHYLRNRLTEIKEKLRPTLDALGLEVGTETWEDSMIVRFVSRPPDGPISPVAISFAKKAGTRLAEAPWGSAHLLITDWARRVVGDSGWDLWTMGEDTYEELPRPLPEMFGRIDDALREHPLVPSLADTPMCLLNGNVANAYDVVSPLVEVKIERHFEHGVIPIEHLIFVDRRRRDVVVSFENGASHAEIYVDCVFKESVPQRDVVRLEEIVHELCDPPARPRPFGA
ncbi:hypothetical protein [Rhizobium leguminosarum]|uniref:hypothetical protein n=1 Tax=Rhizobium leguminosarum TaxID=384 RepID=UPI0004912C8C|nr:hypothetical protein [Rhizobium leguminosarum]